MNPWIDHHTSCRPVNWVLSVHKPSCVTPSEHLVKVVQYSKNISACLRALYMALEALWTRKQSLTFPPSQSASHV